LFFENRYRASVAVFFLFIETMKFRLSLLLLLAPLLAWSGDPNAAQNADFETESAWWPLRVTLAEPLQLKSDEAEHVLPAGHGAVLMRVLEDGVLLLDFGKAGAHRVPLEKTDFAVLFEGIRAGTVEKEIGNYVEMLGPRIIDFSKDIPGPLEFGKIVAKEFILFVYFADLDALSEFEQIFKEGEDTYAQVLPLALRLDAVALGAGLSAYKEAAATIPLLHPQLSEVYARSLQHDAKGPLFFVLTDLDGRVLSRAQRLSKVRF
jgi:hypothetical protein